MNLSFIVNGKPVSVEADPMARLLDILREELALHGVKEGCGEGECGACSIYLNGRLVNSCITPAAAAADGEVLTIEGVRRTERYRIIEAAFLDAGGVQCGFCTPGFVMATDALLSEKPRPTQEETKEALAGNLCRCTGYAMIFEAVKKASERLES